jgi:hypothetical protein
MGTGDLHRDIATAEEAKPVTAGAKVAVDARAVMVLQARD